MCVCMYTLCILGACRVRRGCQSSLEPELWVFVSYHVGPGNWTWVLYKSSKCSFQSHTSFGLLLLWFMVLDMAIRYSIACFLPYNGACSFAPFITFYTLEIHKLSTILGFFCFVLFCWRCHTDKLFKIVRQPALGRQRQADLWVRGQLGLQSEF